MRHELLAWVASVTRLPLIANGDLLGAESVTALGERLRPACAVMIGDRSVDILAARANGLASVGVLWGYGSRAELEKAGPGRILCRPEEIGELIGE